jgi:uncharacterized protein
MLNSKKYIIQFAGLSIGEHLYELDVDDTFFEETNFPDIKHGAIQVNINLLKRSNMMVLDFDIQGFVKTECDRCADEFDLPVIGNYRLIVKTGDGDIGEEDDDIVGIPATESKLDVSGYLYEYILLSLPIKRQHENPENCNQDVLKKLNNFLVEDEKDENTDPRWNELKNIKLN